MSLTSTVQVDPEGPGICGPQEDPLGAPLALKMPHIQSLASLTVPQQLGICIARLATEYSLRRAMMRGWCREWVRG